MEPCGADQVTMERIMALAGEMVTAIKGALNSRATVKVCCNDLLLFQPWHACTDLTDGYKG